MVHSESAVFFIMKITIPIEIVELEENNFHILVTSEFEDGITGNWVIDTGASKTVFDENLTNHYSIAGKSEELFSAGVGEKPFQSSLAILHSVKFGHLQISSLKVALLNMNHINELYRQANQKQICGLLGSDFLLTYKAEISYKNKLLVLNY